MPLRKCMEEHSELELLAWLYWLQNHYEDMTLTDHYLRRVVHELRCARLKRPRWEDSKVRFVPVNKTKNPVDIETISQWSKARWMGIVGLAKRGK